MTTVTKCGFQLLPHTAYSQRLAPSHFYLFPSLKEDLHGKSINNESEVTAAAGEFLSMQDFDMMGIAKLQLCWTKCVDVQGDYVEKINQQN